MQIRKEIGNIILYKEFKDGLLGLKEGDYAVILSYFHESKKVPEESPITFLHPLLEKGEGVSTHAAPGDAMVIILDGEASITIEDKEYRLKMGETIVMPANIPHAVKSITKFKMLLTVVK